MENLFAFIFIGFSVIIIVGLMWLAYLNWYEQRRGIASVDDATSDIPYLGSKAAGASAQGAGRSA